MLGTERDSQEVCERLKAINERRVTSEEGLAASRRAAHTRTVCSVSFVRHFRSSAAVSLVFQVFCYGKSLQFARDTLFVYLN